MNKKVERNSRIALTLLFAGLTFAVLLLFLLMLAAFIIIFVKTDLLSIASGIKINGPLLIFL
ncbi:MAG: hypothetical protein K6G90_14715, partial [Clostridia bacterium]|nr:hypothetical protein [Clostridia bacterium]